jgi:hypothetical protein
MDAGFYGPDADAEDVGDFFLGIFFDREQDEAGPHLYGKGVDRLGQGMGQLMGITGAEDGHIPQVHVRLPAAKNIYAGIVKDLKEVSAEAGAAPKSVDPAEELEEGLLNGILGFLGAAQEPRGGPEKGLAVAVIDLPIGVQVPGPAPFDRSRFFRQVHDEIISPYHPVRRNAGAFR